MKLRNWIAGVLLAAMLVCLAGCSTPGGYAVTVTDEEGKPMVGVALQLCNADSCIMGVTGEDGVATFDAQPDEYKVAFLRLPEGYAADAAEYTFPKGANRLTIVLKKAK